MKKQLAITFLVITSPLLYVSCVSSILKDAPPTFSSEVKLTAPAMPFRPLKASVFPSWKSTKSGNVISIISDCEPNSSNTLSSLHHMVEDSLNAVSTIKEESVEFQNKPAVFKKINGELDGHAIEVQSISFKRKSCGYVSSLSGKKETLEQDKAFFEQFNTSLRF